MSAPSSERGPRVARWRARLADERGSILVISAVLMVALLGLGGLAVDVGQLYVTRARLSGVADAGALAAARAVRMGETRARSAAATLATANGLPLDAQLVVSFEDDEEGRQLVRVTATRAAPLLLGRVLGLDAAEVRATAVATSPPVDLVMVIDQSSSLALANAWDDLQLAAKQFVGFYGEGYDQLSLVSFHVRGVKRTELRPSFQREVERAIDQMTSIGTTNMADGLRLAQEELRSGRAQTGSLRAVIFFTDGWANTYRTTIGGRDLLLSTLTDGASAIQGIPAYYWTNPDQLPTDGFRLPDGLCNGNARAVCPSSQTPALVRDGSRQAALDRAAELRADGVYVYTIGMKDAAAQADPDMDFLRRMANENGISSGSEPQAKAYYAPSSSDLREIFTRVASDMMVRLVY